MVMRLVENDLHIMIKNAVVRILEQYVNFRDEYLTRIPYPVELVFTDHAIERESQRYITEDSVTNDIRDAVHRIVDDFIGGKLGRDEFFKVINRETCSVSVCSLFLAGNRIKKIVVITSYIWDGRMNIDRGAVYYIGEESPAYVEAKEWNAEHQDLVMAYTDWKRNNDIKRQRRKAETKYLYRNNMEMPPEKKMELINKTYDKQARLDKKSIHDAMDPNDFKAIQDYYKKVDKIPMSSKGSANRDLRAMDLWKKRKENQEQ